MHTVGGAQTVEAVPLHHTGGALTAGHPPGDVDDVGRLEHIGGDLLADSYSAALEVRSSTRWRRGGDPPGLVEVAGVRLVHVLGLDRTETELHRGVPVVLGGYAPG